MLHLILMPRTMKMNEGVQYYFCMAVEQGKRSLGYGKPPWIFKGSALYQLHLVKSETARACIPKEFRLVEAFGYTLGGFFLASYDDSPAGVFDELVIIAGLVWNRSTSCAWAAKVLVNSDKACYHGRKEVGLPSHVATFSKRITAIRKQQTNESALNMFGIDTIFCNQRVNTDVQITEIKCPDVTDLCDINLTTTVHASKYNKWMGPEIKMSLPSFSGGTEYNPNFLQYSCQIECRVQAVKPMKVSGAFLMINNEREQHSENHEVGITKIGTEEEKMKQSFSNSVMFSKPILALKFNDMKMRVEAPIVLSECSKVLGASTIKIDLDESTTP